MTGKCVATLVTDAPVGVDIVVLVASSIAALIGAIGVVAKVTLCYLQRHNLPIAAYPTEEVHVSATYWENLYSREDIERDFPITTVSDAPQCVVCLSNVDSELPARKLQCDHTFHAQC